MEFASNGEDLQALSFWFGGFFCTLFVLMEEL